jgi:LacI family transcriptional regulator
MSLVLMGLTSHCTPPNSTDRQSIMTETPAIESRRKRRQKRIALVGLPILLGRSPFNAGLMEYAREHGHWNFIFNAEPTETSFRQLLELDCDGAIVRICSTAMRDEAQKLPFPVVNISGYLENPGVPTIRADQRELGRLCAQHLLERNFQRFAYLRFPGGWLNQTRLEGFLERLSDAGFSGNISGMDLKHIEPDLFSATELRQLRAWVATLTPPVAIFLTDSHDAYQVLETIRSAGLRIPEDIAVIAPYVSLQTHELCVPSLTCADPNETLWAHRAGAYLDRLMRGGKPYSEPVTVPPAGIIAAQSTNIIAVEDSLVRSAMDSIRQHAAENINIKTIAANLGRPRRTIERRFLAAVGMSPHEALLRERVSNAKGFLNTKPRLPLAEIAQRCGFYNVQHMKRAIKRLNTGEASEKD